MVMLSVIEQALSLAASEVSKPGCMLWHCKTDMPWGGVFKWAVCSQGRLPAAWMTPGVGCSNRAIYWQPCLSTAQWVLLDELVKRSSRSMLFTQARIASFIQSCRHF